MARISSAIEASLNVGNAHRTNTTTWPACLSIIRDSTAAERKTQAKPQIAHTFLSLTFCASVSCSLSLWLPLCAD